MSEGTALLVIDMQVGLVAGAYRAGEVLGTIATLLAKARSSGTTVVYLQHESDEFEPLKRGTPTWQIHPDIAPAEGESVISKRASDSFYQTPLRRELEAKQDRSSYRATSDSVGDAVDGAHRRDAGRARSSRC